MKLVNSTPPYSDHYSRFNASSLHVGLAQPEMIYIYRGLFQARFAARWNGRNGDMVSLDTLIIISLCYLLAHSAPAPPLLRISTYFYSDYRFRCDTFGTWTGI